MLALTVQSGRNVPKQQRSCSCFVPEQGSAGHWCCQRHRAADKSSFRPGLGSSACDDWQELRLATVDEGAGQIPPARLQVLKPAWSPSPLFPMRKGLRETIQPGSGK